MDNAFEHQRREDNCEDQCRVGSSSVLACSMVSRISVCVMCEGGPRTGSGYYNNNKPGITFAANLSDLKVVSYNCRGLKIGKNCFYDRLEVEKLLTDNDIVCLQETWLSKQQEGDLKCMNNKCNAVANSPNDDTSGVIVGRRKGTYAESGPTQFDDFRYYF